MSYRVEFEPAALNAAARFLKDDPIGLKSLLDALDTLAENPYPANSTAFGLYRRLRVGPYRALYGVDDDAVRVLILHLGRTA
ncbi:type II toxin-antitoxin system RelE/ParE family toxin [Streptomyces sp. NPDC004787]|uniref:type II toxin-antitoxin system RelE family toxin n=1 Tax=Streptomyces sp. NPDC004787 TaxID=3154291 RepID=UPI0033A44AD2